MVTPLRALLVEDDENDALLLLRELGRGGYDVTHVRVDTRDAMQRALSGGPWDLVLSDFALPRFGAPAALALVREMELDVPFIIVSGTIGEESAVESMRAGAQDFVVKDRLARLVPAIARELREFARRRAAQEERRRAEAERDNLLTELQQAVQARDAFLSIASHELRTPLTSLQLTVQALERRLGRDATHSATKASIDIVARQTLRLGALVENLLDVARITGNTLKLSRERVDLADLAADVVEHSSVVAQQARSVVALDAQSAVGEWDRFRIETVVSNLVSNALKFGAGKPVDISVRREDALARLIVTDQGPGISPEDQARIFGKFERAVPAKHYGGLGLGLWIARQIVEAHGGAIRVASDAGAGSSFTLELPVAAPVTSS
jgi:signal transduction histidine kinase